MTLTLPAPARTTAGQVRALPLLAAVFMTTLDFFIVNVALPSARRELAAGATATSLVAAGYGLAYAASLVVAGRLGDRYGRRRVFTAGLALFTLASAACGLAPAAEVLVAARVVQGVAAALVAPQVLALLGALYPGAARARAFAWYGTTVGLAGMGGQTLGGLLIAADPGGLGWRTCFLVNVPVGLAALAPLRRLVPETFGPARSLDLGGALLLGAGLVLVIVPLTHPGAWPALLAAVPVLGAFAVAQRRRVAAGRAPLLDPALLRDRAFARGLAAVALLFATSAGLTFVLALVLQEHHGLGPLAAGAIFTALNAGFCAAATRAGRFAPPVGAALLAAGLLSIAVTAAGPHPGRLLPGLLLAGAGMGLTMSPLISAALTAAGDELAGQASAVLGTVQELAGVAAVAVTGLVLLGLRAGPVAALAVPAACALLLLALAGRTAR
ncbi:MFS transporter [Spirillospora sp. NPDC127200]